MSDYINQFLYDENGLPSWDLKLPLIEYSSRYPKNSMINYSFGISNNQIKKPGIKAFVKKCLRKDNTAYWTLKDACEGLQIFGATGSGKSSAVLKTYAESYLNSHFGGLVLCAKSEEADTWQKYAAATGRQNDIILFSRETFNFLEYELNRPGEGGGQTENILDIFFQMTEVTDRSGGGNDPFWSTNMKKIFRNAIDLLKESSNDDFNLENLFRIITEAGSQKQPFIKRLFTQVQEKLDFLPDLEKAYNYFTCEFPCLGAKTRESIKATFTGFADPFLRGQLRKSFIGASTFVPEDLFKGKVLIVDCSIHEYGVLGQYIAVIIKFLVQKAIQRRKEDNTNRPVFIWADESQCFTTSNDHAFQQKARSGRGVTVYATQDPSNYKVAFGIQAQDKLDSLMVNLKTQVFCHTVQDVVHGFWLTPPAIQRVAIEGGEENCCNVLTQVHKKGEAFGRYVAFKQDCRNYVNCLQKPSLFMQRKPRFCDKLVLKREKKLLKRFKNENFNNSEILYSPKTIWQSIREFYQSGSRILRLLIAIGILIVAIIFFYCLWYALHLAYQEISLKASKFFNF